MAAKFRFTLQAALDARQRAEDEKKRDFAARHRALEAVGRELERIGRARDRCMSELGASARASAVADLRLRDAYLRRLDAAVAAATRTRSELFIAWESARDAFVTARRARGSLEGLKTRRRRAFEAEEARREELELDESNARAFDRARRERLARERTGSAAS